MKKFLVFCVAIIVTVSLGFMVYYFTLNNESISVAQTTYQLNVGDTVAFEVERVNPKDSTKITYTYDEEGIVEINEENGTLKAVGEGATRVAITTTNKDIAPLFLDVYVGGGSKANPFYIKNQTDLSRIGEAEDVFKLNSSYKLANDIAILGDTTWMSIGSNGANEPTEEFTGIFDGQGNTISNVNLANDLYAGLFAKIGATGVVSNLIVSNVNISGNCAYAGGIAAVNNGTIRDCYVTSGSLTSTYPGACIGGIVGNNESVTSTATIYKCLSNVTINSTNVDKIGGIAGRNAGAEVNYCYTETNTAITATTNAIVGGIVGQNTYSSQYTSAVAGCYVLGTFNGENTNTHGGIVGVNDYNSSTTIADKTNKIFGNYYFVDSFARGVGNFDDVENGSDSPDAEHGIYGVEPKNYNDLCEQSTFKLLRNAKTDVVVGWNFVDVWTMATAGTPKFNKDGAFVANGRGLLIKAGQVNTATKLAEITNGQSVEIGQDIDLGGAVWNPLNLSNVTIYGSEQFREENGRYPSIYNFKLANGENVGFFGILSNSTIENLNFEQVSNVSSDFAGVNNLNMGIVACQIDAQTVLDNISTSQQVSTSYANILSANVSSNLEGKTIYVGGLVGADYGRIANCKSDNVTANITYSSGVKANANVGGITGSLLNANGVEKSVVTGFKANVNSNNDKAVGGVVGELNANTKVSDCYVENSNIVTDIAYVDTHGSLIGHYEGGLVGISRVASATIAGSAVNNVTIQGFVAGGIVGSVRGTISNCYARAFVTGYKVGGVAGYQFEGKISNVRVDGQMANPVNDISYNIGDSSIYAHGSQKAGIACISYGTEGNLPRFENVFVNCTFTDDGHTAYRTTATMKDNKNTFGWVYSGVESNIVYNADKCSNARERGIVEGYPVIGAVLDFAQGSTSVSSYSTNNDNIANGNYDVFTKHGFTVENWSFSGAPMVEKCVRKEIQNA